MRALISLRSGITMERDLKNKVVVVTGAAQGIGYAIAVKCLEQSCSVILLDLNETLGKEVTKKLAAEFGDDRVAFMKCDVTKDLEGVSRKILEIYKKVDVLVNNAGIVNEFDLRATLEVNTVAVIEWTLKFREHMRLDKGGHGGTIINIASIYGYVSDPFLPFYKSSKYAVLGFTNTIGHQRNYNKTGVRIVAICPGYTSSVLMGGIRTLEEDQKDFEDYAGARPWQNPADVANAAEEVFKVADSGTSWAIVGGQPIEKVPNVMH